MPDIKKINIYFKKREEVLTRIFYFSAGFMISMGLMAQCYPHGRISKQVKFYDLEEKHMVNPSGKNSFCIRTRIGVNI